MIVDYAEIFWHWGGSYYWVMLIVLHVWVREFQWVVELLAVDLAVNFMLWVVDVSVGGEHL